MFSVLALLLASKLTTTRKQKALLLFPLDALNVAQGGLERLWASSPASLSFHPLFRLKLKA